jgi:hypothetical protein
MAMQKKILFFLLCIGMFACKNSKRTLPDVSNIKVDVSIDRFDNAFFNTKITTPERLPILQKEYGKLFDYFLAKTSITDRIAMGATPTMVVEEFLRIHKPLYDSTQLLYKDLSWLEKDLQKGFQYYQYYFRGFKVPKIYSIVDGFYSKDPKAFYGIEYGADTLQISLQMFLGKDFSGYDPQIYFDYLRTRFTQAYIIKNIFTTIIDANFKSVEPGSALIDQMIDAGKRVYLLDQVLPNTPDEVKLGYGKAQLKDCYANELMIWSTFVNQNILFTVEPSIIKEYIGENPYTKALGMDSPGNIGNFVGWQIVKKYMQQNSISPAQLMETDNRKIYIEAKYKPD